MKLSRLLINCRMFLPRGESDEVLFDLLKKDSERAFNELYQRYWEKLLQVAFVKLQSQEDAEEVVQETFLNLWNSRATTQIRFTFNTYISSVLKYMTYTKIAERKKLNVISLEDNEFKQIPDNSTQNWLAYSEIRSEIESLVSMLPEKCQMVYRYSRDMGLNEREISERMGINDKTVQGHLTKALKFIKNNLSLLFVFH